ncbi:MAG: MoxR family ATPase [Deltaproteobacteria bacterium]|nr:MoxR family ATPase [Deltaproteobacteria bacterium]MBI3076179.1 MoxR family ATPase [Deltaproteobacteria bacterium]
MTSLSSISPSSSPHVAEEPSQVKVRRLQANIERAILGKADVIKQAVVTLLARGHLLIEDVPGVGKSTLARCLAKSLRCSFRRIQFTSDLLPSDILGVSVYNQRTGEFEFHPGPLFANIVLADEINRTTPKTQSCLLQAMNDGQVSIDSMTYPLPVPFMVVATQNPMEFHGTYPLPESQMDRFTMRIRMGYPPPGEEREIVRNPSLAHAAEELPEVLSAAELLELQVLVEQVKVDEALVSYLLQIISATRESPLVELGASPRAAIQLYKVGQAMAFVEGRDYCVPDDIKAAAPAVLAHRVIPRARFGADHNHGDAHRLIEEILTSVPAPA